MSLGLSAMVRGAAAGLEDIKNQQKEEEDRQYELRRREREETEWKQKQEDRQYRLKRREITDQREDEDYEMKREAAQRTKQVQDAMRDFGASGFTDLTPFVEVTNNFLTDGKIVDWQRTNDGNFLIRKQMGTGEIDERKVTPDQIGMGLQLIADPKKWYEAEKVRRAKEAEREFELKKIRTKGEEDRKTERVKSGLSSGKLTKKQQATNAEIDAARKIVSKLSRDEIRGRTQQYTDTGRENPDYDPYLANLVKKATSRKVGDDEEFAGIFEQMYGEKPRGDDEAPAGKGAAASQPPVKGARLAKDGHWYVKKGGKWFKVETD